MHREKSAEQPATLPSRVEVARVLLSCILVTVFFAGPVDARIAGPVCADTTCGIRLTAALDQRVVPVNAELTYLHNCNPPLAFTYSDGSEIAPGPAHIGGSRSWASFDFEVGREVSVYSIPRCLMRSGTPDSLCVERENDCCTIFEQEPTEVSRFVVGPEDTTGPRAPDFRTLCREDGYLFLEYSNVPPDAMGLDFALRLSGDEFIWNEGHQPLDRACDEAGQERDIPYSAVDPYWTGGNPDLASFSGAVFIAVRSRDSAGNFGPPGAELTFDYAACEVVSPATPFGSVDTCTGPGWPRVADAGAGNPLAAELSAALPEPVSLDLDQCNIDGSTGTPTTPTTPTPIALPTSGPDAGSKADAGTDDQAHAQSSLAPVDADGGCTVSYALSKTSTRPQAEPSWVLLLVGLVLSRRRRDSPRRHSVPC